MTTDIAFSAHPATDQSIYNRRFWLAFAANFALVTANALTFRFAEFVAFLGGSEAVAGAIVSVGMIGALIGRLAIGQTIDRYGTRLVWPIGSMFFVVACLMFLCGTQLSWVLYVARVAFAIGLAAMITCSIVHIQNQVPAFRRTEVIGSLGSSGFIGMIAGTQMGDVIFHTIPEGRQRFVVLFGLAMTLGLFYIVAVTMLTFRQGHERPQHTPGAHRLIFRYWPGNVVLAAMMMGMAFTVISVFLTRFATHRGMGGIGMFFASFCVSAFAFRIVGRRWSRTIGRHRLILLGLAGQVTGMATLPLVTQSWHFAFPAIGYAFGHALLFPSVVSLGAGAFPIEYRGSGTTIVLGFTEVGAMLSAEPLGWIIVKFGFTPMFLTVAGLGVVVAIVYWITDAHKHDDEIVRDDAESETRESTADRPMHSRTRLPQKQPSRFNAPASDAPAKRNPQPTDF